MRAIAALLVGLAVFWLDASARAADYPDKVIKLVVGYPPGGPIDVTLSLTGTVTKEQTLSITPKVVYPSAPECGGDQRTAGLTVSPDGTVSAT